MLVPALWVTSFVLIFPLYAWKGHRLIPNEFTCRIPKEDSLSITYATVLIYSVPYVVLIGVYWRVHQFLRRQSAQAILTVRSRYLHQRRDVLVFRRIMIVVFLLGIYGLPNAVMLMTLAVTGHLVVLFYRILELSIAACVFTLSIALFYYINPGLRREIPFCQHEESHRAAV
jgi:hypothetical protein